MITIAETGVQYAELSKGILEHHKNDTFAWVERPLTYKKEVPAWDDREMDIYVNDITPQEKEKGLKHVRGFFFREEADPLFFQSERGELDRQIWLDVVNEIKEEYS